LFKIVSSNDNTSNNSAEFYKEIEKVEIPTVEEQEKIINVIDPCILVKKYKDEYDWKLNAEKNITFSFDFNNEKKEDCIFFEKEENFQFKKEKFLIKNTNVEDEFNYRRLNNTGAVECYLNSALQLFIDLPIKLKLPLNNNLYDKKLFDILQKLKNISNDSWIPDIEKNKKDIIHIMRLASENGFQYESFNFDSALLTINDSHAV
jgi:hypothetical protein